MTFSIVALDPATGDLGVAVQSKFLAVGAVVPWAKAGVGAIATQSFANVGYGPDGLALLADGLSADDALADLVTADSLRDQRQVGIVDAQARSATYTGGHCFAWAGGRTGEGFAAQGNILARAEVVDGLADTFLAGGRPFPELLVACLAAADAAGGDRRGRESAALLIVRAAGGYGGGNDRWMDLRVDHHADPIGELARLVDFQHLYYDRPSIDELQTVDEALAAEIRSLLESLGAGPGGRFGAVYMHMGGAVAGDPEPRPFVGEPQPYPSNWDARWQRALDDWMGVENLEERAAAPGWIDRRVLARRSAARAAGLTPATIGDGTPTRVVGPVATNVHVLADARSREAIAIDTATPCLAWIAGRARRARLDAQADRLDPRALGPHRRQRRGRGAHRRARSPSIRSIVTGWSTPCHCSRRSTSRRRCRRSSWPRAGSSGSGRSGSRVLHTPGHTEGSVCLLAEDDGLLYSGDTLFAAGWGRVDLPGGDAGGDGRIDRPPGRASTTGWRSSRGTASRPRSVANGPGWSWSATAAGCSPSRADALERAPVGHRSTEHREPEALVQPERAARVLGIHPEHRLVHPGLAELDHGRGRQGARHAALPPRPSDADLLEPAATDVEAPVLLGPDPGLDHARHLVAVPGHGPQVGVGVRLVERLAEPLLAVIVGLPVVLECLRAGVVDGSVLLRQHTAHLDAVGQRERFHLVEMVASHQEEVANRLQTRALV